MPDSSFGAASLQAVQNLRFIHFEEYRSALTVSGE